VLFKVPDDCKENGDIHHRCIFCVLTWDSVIIYDTHHDHPLSVISGIHYSNLVDAAWTADGRKLCVCSTDGFITFIEFADGELGEVFVPPAKQQLLQQQQEKEMSADESSCRLANLKINTTISGPTTTTTTLPPCEAGLMAVQAPPTKRAKLESSKRGAVENLDEANAVPKKKKRVQPILIGTSTTG
jgi:hypothetical protein